MTDLPIHRPPRPKPKPGTLPLTDEGAKSSERASLDGLDTKFSDAPWNLAEPRPAKRSASFGKLRTARRKAEQLADVVRDEAFDDWVRRCLVVAHRPDEWTRASELYENYLKRASRHGGSRSARALSREAVASETRWGRMMGSLFVKTRRAKGWYYPVRLKRGA